MDSQLAEPYSAPHLPDKPKKKLTAVEIVVVLCMLFVLGIVLIQIVFVARDLKKSKIIATDGGRLRNLGLAIMEYEQHYHCLPPAYTVDANGNKLHSWRTLILPYLDQAELYQQIDLSKPWDAPQNKQVASTMSFKSFGLASAELPPGHTYVRAIVHPRGVFSGPQTETYDSIHDDKDETILIVQAGKDQSTPWMKPEDYTLFDFLQAHNDTSLYPDGSTHIMTSAGSIRTIHVQQTGSKAIESMIIIDDGGPTMPNP